MMDVETPQGEAERYPAVPLASTQPTGLQIEHLPDGPFLNMTEYLDTQSLAKMDQVCKNFRQINRDLGPWKNAGIRSFRGMEIEGEVFNDGNKPTGSNEDPVRIFEFILINSNNFQKLKHSLAHFFCKQFFKMYQNRIEIPEFLSKSTT